MHCLTTLPGRSYDRSASDRPFAARKPGASPASHQFPMTTLSFPSFLSVGAVLLVTTSIRADVIRVHPAGLPPHDGASWSSAYRSLSEALAAARGGDEIWVAGGTYKPGDGSDPAATFELQANVTLYGGFTGTETLRDERNPAPLTNGTVIDGDLLGDDGPNFTQRSDNSHHLVTALGLTTPAGLDGFTIRGGNGLAGPAPKDGGGLLVITSTVHLANLRFVDNQGDAGAGAFLDRSTVSLDTCTFEANVTWPSSPGGGIAASQCDLTLTSVSFLANEADVGGGLHVYDSSLTGANLVFERNEARYGAGLNAWRSEAFVTNTRFTRNTANWNDGGAVRTSFSQVDFVNTLFAGNRAAGTAGAIYIAGESTATDDGSTVRAVNCTFYGNEGDTSSPGGGAMYCNDDSSLTIQNSILWNNRAPYGDSPLAGKAPEPATANNLIEGGLAGYPHIIDADPRFLDPAGPDGIVGSPDDDLRLSSDSPAIGAGNPVLLPSDTADLDGDANIQEPTPLDLGGATREVKLGLELGVHETQALVFHAPDVRLPAGTTGPVVVPEWIRGAAADDEFTYEVVLRSGSGALAFSSPPEVSSTGALSFTPAPGAGGHATFELSVSDASGVLPAPPPQTVLVALGPVAWRVTPGGSGARDGSTWSDAVAGLTPAFDLAVPGDQVWVASGTYRPSSPPAQPSFRIPDAIQVFGGFDGGEMLLSERDPDPLTNGTILDGDVLGDDEGFDHRSDNAWHVVRFDDVGSDTRLDGFTITGGEAVGQEPADFDQRKGGGILNSGSPVLANLHLIANRSTDTGGALHSNQGGPHILDCRFENNEAGLAGGAVSLDGAGSTDTELLILERSHFRANRSSNGGALDGGRSDLLIRSCRFENNSAEAGGALFLAHNTCTVLKCDFVANVASSGGAVDTYNHGGQFINVRFLGNRANYAGACRLRSGGASSFVNALFSGNSAAVRGGAIDLRGAGLTLIHSTLAGNTAQQAGGLWLDSSSPKTLRNCVLWGNQAGTFVSEVDAPSPHYLTLTPESEGLLVRGGWPGRPGVSVTNPNFANPDGVDGITGTDDDDLTPAPGSAACGTALPGALPADGWDLDTDDDTAEDLPLDLNGQLRHVAPGIDLGAVEVQSPTLHLPAVRLSSPPTGAVVVDPWIVNLDPSQPPTFTTSIGSGGTLDFITEPQVTSDGVLSFELAPDTSGFAVIGLLADHGGVPEPVGTFSIIVSPTVHFVRADTPSDGAGTHWANAFERLSDALAVSSPGDEVHVAAGHYQPVGIPAQAASFRLKNGVRLRGGYTGSETGPDPTHPGATATQSILSGRILDGESNRARCYHVVTAEGVDGTAVLESFVVTGGRAYGPGQFGADGGGIQCLNASPTLRNLAVLDNSAGPSIQFPGGSGGGLFLQQSHPLVDRCFFGGNAAGYGGGIYLGSGSLPVVVNSILSGNQAYRGGALYVAGTGGSIINSTIVGNLATSSGAGAYGASRSSATLANTIVRDNRRPSGAASEIYGGPFASGDVSHCFVAGGYRGLQPPQVFLTDPLLVNPPGPDAIHGTLDDDLRLLVGSPALNAGLDSLLPAGSAVDFDGAPRLSGPSVDVGALEGAVTARFGLLHPGLPLEGDENGNGRTNYEDYATGASPVGPHDPSVQPTLHGNQLTLTHRNNAADVFVRFEKSSDLRNWLPLVEGPGDDYTLQSSNSSGGRTTLNLILAPRSPGIPRLFFREDFDATTP